MAESIEVNSYESNSSLSDKEGSVSSLPHAPWKPQGELHIPNNQNREKFLDYRVVILKERMEDIVYVEGLQRSEKEERLEKFARASAWSHCDKVEFYGQPPDFSVAIGTPAKAEVYRRMQKRGVEWLSRISEFLKGKNKGRSAIAMERTMWKWCLVDEKRP